MTTITNDNARAVAAITITMTTIMTTARVVAAITMTTTIMTTARVAAAALPPPPPPARTMRLWLYRLIQIWLMNPIMKRIIPV